jgi:vancomycin resistance protein VanK
MPVTSATASVRYVGEWGLPLRPMVYRAFDFSMRRLGR